MATPVPDPDFSSDTGSDTGSDTELIDAIRRGDAAAFTQLMCTYVDPLRRFAYSLVEDVASADDVVQDVFAAIWMTRSKWKPTHGARTYLFGAVRNRLLDVGRHLSVRKNAQPVLAESLAYAAAQRDGDPTSQIEHRQDVAALQRAVRELTERRRTALRLRYVEQMTVPEIARVMNVSPKAAEQLVWQATHAIRAALERTR